jgi:hypothetical protein
VSASVQLGVLFAVATAFSSVVGFMYKRRGALESPRVDPRRPVRSSLALFRSPAYVLGILIAQGSWGLHVTALALAPISLVQAVIAGGLVLVTVVADRIFGLPVTRREWVGVAAAAAGLAFLAATVGGTVHGAENSYAAPTLALYVGGLTVAGLGLAAASGRVRTAPGVLLALSAGLLWGGSDISIKALSGALSSAGVAVVVHPLALVILVLSLVGLAVSARSLQVGDAVVVIATTSAAANLVTIAAGPIVFGEPLPSSPAALIAHLAALALVIVAVALTPAPAARSAPVGLDA